MKRLLGLILLATLVTSLPAADPPQGLEQQVQVLERRVRALSELVLRMDRLQQEVQHLRGEIEVQNHTIDSMKKRQRDLYLDIDRRLGQMSGSAADAPATQLPPGGQPAAAPVESADVSGRFASGGPTAAGAVRQSDKARPGEERAYHQAFDLLTERRYGEARKSFQSFLNRYPGGQYADNAQYWLGEASYVTRDFDAAFADFSAVLEQYPDSPKVPGAMLKIGYIEYE